MREQRFADVLGHDCLCQALLCLLACHAVGMIADVP